MNKTFLLLFIFLSHSVISADIKVPCLKKDGSLGLNLEKYDCKLIAKVVESPEIKNAHEDKVLDVLANQLSFKIKRNMENMAVIDNYFGPLNLALTEDKAVRTNCNIDVITSLSSNANKCSTKNPKKLEKLITKLTDEMGTKSAAVKDLRTALREKFFSSRGVSEIQGCPLNKSSGYYMLNSQLSDIDLKSIFERFKKSGKSSYKDLVYKTYPQLKIIARSDSPEFQEKFEKYVADFQGNDEERVDYFYNFFKSEQNQDKLSLGLANNCIDVKESIETYMCNDLDHLGMSDDYVENIFSEEKDPESAEIAKAFNCSNNLNDKHSVSKNNIENWMDVFQKNTVPMQSEQTAESNVMNFCDIFLCKDAKAKELSSCKTRNQISSIDLEKMYGCKEKDKACTEEVRKRVVYLESLEKIYGQKKAYEIASSTGGASTNFGKEEKKKSSPYSSFFQNFVGVEGTLQAEGKKITPATVAEKVKDFEERKIEPIPSANRDILLANNEGNKVYNMIKQQKQEEALNQQAHANQQVAAQHGFVPSIKDNDDHKQAVIANSLSKFKGAVAGANKDEFQASREQDRKAEISRMRSELEGVLKEMKGSEEDKLQTITDNNNIYAQPKTAGKDDPYKGMSAEERERLENYRSNLATWESRLRARESDVLDRELRIGSRSTASTSDSGDKRFENGKTNSLAQDTAGSAQNPAHTGAGSVNGGLKLTKAQASAGGPQGTTEGGTVQASGKISEGEAIVAAENLATLEKSTLKKWGLSARDSFVIKVRLLDRIVDVPVKSFTYSGKSMFVPILTKENRELSKLILESPLFSDYRLYQQERLKVLDRI